MISFIYNVFEWSFAVRVAIGLLLLLFLWMILGKLILWGLSLIPFVLKKIFILIYLIIKMPIIFLHKMYGRGFYKLDNRWAEIGEHAHDFLERWYTTWHHDYKTQFRKACIITVVCYLFIVIPSYISIDIKVLNVGKSIYCFAENLLKEEMEEYFSPSDLEQEWFSFNEVQTRIKLTVYDVNTTLYVQDIPSKDNSLALDMLYNGDKVIWTGEIIFVEWGKEEIEPLVKVITEDGTEGWSLLDYLYPEDYINIELKVGEME